VQLRPLTVADFEVWQEVRRRCRDWLLKWEPKPLPGQPDAAEDRRVFAARCGARDRERQLGSGYGFGIFVEGRFGGEINVSGIQRGPFQNAYVGYWIDEALAGHGYTPEAAAVVFRFAFEELALHRLQVAIIPRNGASRRVADKLGLREEGIAERYLEINGVWEDHVRYAITAEEWDDRRDGYLRDWISG
jgi:ribosomal-protein-alanine N-acetyltransferase